MGFNACYRVPARLVVFQGHVQGLPRLLSLFRDGLHEPRVLELLGYCVFERRVRHGDAPLLNGACVLEAYHEISHGVVCHTGYQEDFFIPGILPSSASSRKQMRQRLKSRMNPRGRPHLKQRRTVRLENFGFRLAFMIIDFLAMYRLPRGDWEALASGACAADLQKLLRVTLFFV